jgi:isorenieratene synthase
VDPRVSADAPAFRPGSDAARPGVVTDAPGVRLAGDGVRLPFPTALMERAAASGFLAAGDILSAVGAAAEPVWSVPARGLLAARGARLPARPGDGRPSRSAGTRP